MQTTGLTIIKNTFLKQSPIQSSKLSKNSVLELEAGTKLECSLISLETRHYQVGLEGGMAPWGDVGFIYHEHVKCHSALLELLLSDQYPQIRNRAIEMIGGEDNTCTAFASTTLRTLGVDVAEKNVVIEGEECYIPINTRAFSDWLKENLPHEKVTNPAALVPGDVCFTRDNNMYPGFPAHTFFFIRYDPQDRGLAYVVDNRGQNHIRNLDTRPKLPDGREGKAYFSYALRLTNFN